MTPFMAMSFRALVKQFLTWVGYTTDSGASGDNVLTFNNDGTVTFPDSSTGKWLNKTPDVTEAALYEIRWTAAAGVLTETTALTQNVWYALSSDRAFSISGTQGAANRSSVFAIAIRRASDGGDGVPAVWQHIIAGTG